MSLGGVVFKLKLHRLGLLGALCIATTLQGGWGPIDNVTHPFSFTKRVNLASDANGVATALIVDETTSTLCASTFNGEWQADNLSTPFDASDDTDMAIDGRGNLLAVWTQVVGGKREVHLSEKPLGGNWMMPLTLSESNRDCCNPRVVVTPAGEVTVTWNQGLNYYIERISGLWGTPLPLSTETTEFSNFQMVCDPSGRVMAVWTDRGRLAASQKIGGLWQIIPDFLSPAGKTVEYPQVSLNQKGTATCIWVQDGQITSCTKEADSAWSPSQTLFSEGRVTSKPVLLADTTGNITLFAKVEADGFKYIEAHFKPFQEPWESVPQFIAEGGDNVVAAMDLEGNILCAWTTASDTLKVKIKSIHSNWPKNAQTLSFNQITNLAILNSHTLLWDNPTLHNIQSITVVKDPEIKAIDSEEESSEEISIEERFTPTVSEPNEPTQERVKPKEHHKKTHLKAPEVRSPIRATGSQRKIRFLSQTSLVNVITWRPPANGPRPKFYKIYRNSALTNLAGKLSGHGPLVFNDHQRKRNTIYTYYIVAVDALGNTSEPAVVTVYPE